MKDFAINYAYDGFLYSPLFLAKQMGFLPNHAQLTPRNGDVDAIGSLGRFGEKCENWFAICDPFADDLSGVAILTGERADSVCIVGAFVGRLPVWLYGINPDCKPFINEQQIKGYKPLIKNVVCYEKYNTGFLIGKHVSDLIDPGQDRTHEVPFGNELKNLQPNEIAVTSDVLSVAESLLANNGNVKFDLFRNNDSLDPFLFTAVLTLRSVVEQQLPTVLAVLSGLQTAVKLFEDDDIPNDGIDFLANLFAAQLPHAPTLDARRTIIRAGARLLATDKIYSGKLDIATAERGYNNARNEWHKTLKRPFGPVESQKEPIPSLLMQGNWRCDHDLAKELANGWKLTLGGAKGKSNDEPVVAVAKAWSDDETTVKTVTKVWLEAETSKHIVNQLVGLPPIQIGSQPLENAGFSTLVPYISLAYLPFLLVPLFVVTVSQKWEAGFPILGSCLSLMLLMVLLAYYWHPRKLNTMFRWIAGILILIQIAIVASLCRDALYPENSQWGHHELLWAVIGTILIAAAAKALAEPYR